MITRLRISNYRSLGRNINLCLGRLSVFIGPNGSGKSNTLDVLSFVRDAVTQGLSAAITHRGGIDSVRRRSHGAPFDMHIALDLQMSSGPATYSFVVGGDRMEEYKVKSEEASVIFDEGECRFDRDGTKWSGPDGLSPRMDEQALVLTTLGGDERFKELVSFLSQLTVYAIFPDMLRQPQIFNPSRPMQRHGENWVSVLRELIRQPVKDDLIKALSKLTGDIEDIRVTSAAGFLIAEFKQYAKSNKRKRWFGAAQQSDGTLRVAGLLTALLQKPSISIIGIEEPELTVHPGVLPMIYDYLRQATEESQVLITTHSPVMLDVVDVERDAIYVVNRVDATTQIKQVSYNQLKPVRKSLLRLGDLFLSGELQLSLFDQPEI